MEPGRHGKARVNVQTAAAITVAVFLAIFVFASLNSVHTYDPRIRQKAQLNALNAAIEMFNNEFDGYPPSEANDRIGRSYGGAMKLAEALVGQDLLGFHDQSSFRCDGTDVSGVSLYPARNDQSAKPSESNLLARKGPFVQAENARACRLAEVYGKGNTGPFAEDTLVLCDIFEQRRPSGQKTGMPILYYRADPLGTAHDVNHPDNPRNIYHYQDNQPLALLGIPGKPRGVHALVDPKRFYQNTLSPNSRATPEPQRRDTFILISAGPDGEYGTADDICNFEWRYRQY